MRADARELSSGMAVAFAGFVLYSVYVCMTFVSPTTISSVVEIGYLPKALYLFFIILGRMAGLAAVAVILVRRKRQPPLAASVAASAACALVGFAIMVIVFQLTSVAAIDALLPWFFASGVWIGAGDAFAIVLWFAFVSALPIRSSYVFMVGASVVAAVLYIATTFLPAPVPWIVAVASYFGALACCVRALRDNERAARAACPVSSAADGRAFRHLGRPLVGVALMAFMAGLMMNVAGQEKISLETYQWTAFVIMFSLNGILLLPALLAPHAFQVPRLYKFILPLSALGFLLLPLAWDAIGRGMVNSFVQVGFTFTNIIFYCLIAEEYRSEKASPLKVFCIMQLVVMGANFAGLFFAFFYIGYLEPGDIALTILALVAVYLILIATLVLFKDKNLVKGGSARRSAPKAGDAGMQSAGANAGDVVSAKSVERAAVLDGANGAEGMGGVGGAGNTGRSAGTAGGIGAPECGIAEHARESKRAEALMERAGLSAREREVLDHLRQGRAPKTIAKLLFVSENTVRFHIRNIYQKFGVHSRTELMELFDEGLDARR